MTDRTVHVTKSTLYGKIRHFIISGVWDHILLNDYEISFENKIDLTRTKPNKSPPGVWPDLHNGQNVFTIYYSLGNVKKGRLLVGNCHSILTINMVLTRHRKTLDQTPRNSNVTLPDKQENNLTTLASNWLSRASVECTRNSSTWGIRQTLYQSEGKREQQWTDVSCILGQNYYDGKSQNIATPELNTQTTKTHNKDFDWLIKFGMFANGIGQDWY
jgi:hypothetical protein